MVNKKLRDGDEMDRLMGVFGFNITESIIYKTVLRHPLYSATEIWGTINSNGRKVPPYIYTTLNVLVTKGWIKKVGEKPNRYMSESKKKIRNALDFEIAETQNLVELQKKSYRVLLDIIENGHKPQSDLQKHSETASISNRLKKMPVILQDWISLSQQTHKWLIGKTEANMRITFPWEKIEFRFNSIEFEMFHEQLRLFGGLILVDITNNELGDIHQTVQRIHNYNLNGFKFAYKMERKGYNESKIERHITDVELNSGSYDEQTYRSVSDLNLRLQGINSSGKVITTAVSEIGHWIVTIWAENSEILEILEQRSRSLMENLQV